MIPRMNKELLTKETFPIGLFIFEFQLLGIKIKTNDKVDYSTGMT